MGPIMLMETSDPQEITFVVDGQQRIATAAILLATIRDLAGNHPDTTQKGRLLAAKIHHTYLESEGPRGGARASIHLGDADHRFFEDHVRRRPRNVGLVPQNASSGLIKKARNQLETLLVARVGGRSDYLEQLAAIVQVVAKRAAMVAIYIRDDEQALNVFERINERGRPLSEADLVRHRLMQDSTRADRDTIRRAWTGLENLLGDSKAKLTDFLGHYITSHTGARPTGRLHLAVYDHVKETRDKPVDLATELERSCAHYCNLLKQIPTGIHNEARKSVRATQASLGAKAILPLLLAGGRFRTRIEFARLAKAVEALVIRHSFFAGRPGEELNRTLHKAAALVRQAPNSGFALESALACLRDVNPKDREVVQAAERRDFVVRKSAALYLLRQLEDSVAKSDGATKSEASLEHIFPVKWHQHWGSRRNLVPYLWHLGNLTLLTARENARAGNRNYSHKKTVYIDSSIAITNVIPKADRWGIPPIEKRSAWLAEVACKRWKL